MLLCDFHREQAWDRWLSSTTNGLRPQKEQVLDHLRCIAKAETVPEVDQRIMELKKSEIWMSLQGERLRSWMERTWLPSRKVCLEFTPIVSIGDVVNIRNDIIIIKLISLLLSIPDTWR